MQFNHYKISSEDSKLIVKDSSKEEVHRSILERLEEIEEKLILVSEEKQLNKVGFSNIGAAISSAINPLFGEIDENVVLIKATENKRAIHRLIFRWVRESIDNEVYVFIYTREFGSMLVDRSTIILKSIVGAFEEVLELCAFREEFSLHVIEVTGLSNAYVYEAEKTKRKTYYRISRK